MIDLTTLFVSTGLVLVFVSTLLFWCIKRFELAIFLIALSPWVSAIFIANSPLFPGEKGTGIGSYIRIGILMLMGAVGMFKYFKSTSFSKPITHLLLLGLFLLFAVLSTFYSIDQRYTLIRSVSFIALFGFMMGLHSWLKTKLQLYSLFNTLWVAVSICLLINILSIPLAPERAWFWEENYRLQCLWGHPNSLGAFCMIAYPVLMWRYAHSTPIIKWGILFTIFLVVGLHGLSGSRTTITASILGVSMWWFVLKEPNKLLTFVSISIIVALMAVSIKIIPVSFERRETSGLTNLTGRPEIWRSALTLAGEKPVLGYGYAADGKIFQDPRFYHSEYAFWSGSARSSLHNGYISVLVGVGAGGLLLFLIILAYPLWHNISLKKDHYKAFLFSIMSMCLLTNLLESSITGGTSITATFFWITWVMAGKLRYVTDYSSSDEEMELPSFPLLQDPGYTNFAVSHWPELPGTSANSHQEVPR
jgi:O-antigen ligase